jgi:ATP-binding cassette subfamily F protein 3
MDFLTRLSEKTERLSLVGADNYKAEIELTLKGLGFERTDFTRETREFSGGWRMRIELAKILLSHPDIILLDEPTNHLDIESIQWLEDFLKDYSGAVVVISHDRAFLDNVTTRTIEIVLGKIYDYKANYSKYLVLRQERFEQQMNAYRNQQKMIEDTEKFIERFRYKATKSVQVQSRIKQLEKLERIQVDDFDKSALNIKFPPAPHSGVITVRGKHVSKAFGDHTVLNDVDFEIERGEKVAFVGRNGEGKTTMARMIMRELEYKGEIVLGHAVKIGYFAQNQADLLNPEDTVFDTVDRVAVGDIRTKIRDILGAFMFSGEDIDKKVGVLSGGERTRLAMIRLLLEPVNLLILDEPTNHLDIRSKEILKQAIKDFNGTVIVVSHDREFLDGLVNKMYEFRGGKMKLHIGGIYDFLRERKMESLKELEAMRRQDSKPAKTAPAPPPKVEEKPAKAPVQTLSYEQKKELDRKINKLSKAVKEAEDNIAKTEAELKSVEQQLNNCSDNNKALELSNRHAELSTLLENYMTVWTEKQEELETLQN